ncbi:MAG TPA: nitroreductase family deazaflavin-dependent oxidoreductase [Gaiellaceae bacterium]|jgi:deazaflavin-dependent oxidoreductase (nitroreductase family)
MRRWLFRLTTRVHTPLYRLTKGRIGGSMGRAPILILTTTGRKTGELRSNPLLYQQDGDAYLVVASAGGQPKNPAWYRNLEANPEAEIQVKDRTLPVRAETAGPDRRPRLWQKMTAVWPGYDEYQTKTEREIPVVVLSPRTSR